MGMRAQQEVARMFLVVLVGQINNAAGWLPPVGWLMRLCLEKPLEVTFTANDYYLRDNSGASYGGSVSAHITCHDKDLKQVFRPDQLSIVIRAPIKFLPFVRLKKMSIPAAPYSMPDLPLELYGLKTVKINCEFGQTLQRGQEFGENWSASLVMGMIGRIRSMERVFTPKIGEKMQG